MEVLGTHTGSWTEAIKAMTSEIYYYYCIMNEALTEYIVLYAVQYTKETVFSCPENFNQLYPNKLGIRWGSQGLEVRWKAYSGGAKKFKEDFVRSLKNRSLGDQLKGMKRKLDEQRWGEVQNKEAS